MGAGGCISPREGQNDNQPLFKTKYDDGACNPIIQPEYYDGACGRIAKTKEAKDLGTLKRRPHTWRKSRGQSSLVPEDTLKELAFYVADDLQTLSSISQVSKTIYRFVKGVLKMQLSVYAVGKYRVPYPLVAAVGVGCVADYEALVNIGNYDVNQRNDFGFTPLISAATKSQNDAARFLLAQPNIDVNAETDDGWTALAWAVQNGNVELTKWLLEHEDLKNINGTVCEDYYLSPYDLRAYSPQHVPGFLRLKVSWQSMSRHRPFPTLLLGMHFHRGRDHDEIIEMLLSKSLHRGISKKHLNIALTLAQCNGHTKLAETMQRFMMGMEDK